MKLPINSNSPLRFHHRRQQHCRSTRSPSSILSAFIALPRICDRFGVFAWVVLFGFCLEMHQWMTFTQQIPVLRADLPIPEVAVTALFYHSSPSNAVIVMDVKPRVVALGDEGPADTRSLNSTSRILGRLHSVARLGGPCSYCEKDSSSHIFPFERPYYEQCTPMADWQTKSFPNCNRIHEIGMADFDSNITLLNMKGSWRSVWKSTFARDKSAVLKLLKFERKFDHESYYYHRVDALAMERLTSSPHIIDVYGYCGQTVLTEYATGSARTLVKNPSFGSTDRLRLGIDLARAFVALHSIDYEKSTNATLAHNDINLMNAVEVNGRIKLNDFNIGVIMKWNGTQPCGYPVRFEAKLWKSPEENANTSYIDPASADVYGLGNLLFQVMTKHQPWTHLEPGGPVDKHEVARRKMEGALPFVPEKHAMSNKTAIQTLYYATMSCLRPNPEDRLTSFQLARKLELMLEVATTKGVHVPRHEIKRLFEKTHSKLK